MAQEIADSKLIDTWSSSGLIVKPDISKIIEGWQFGEQPPHEYMNWLENTFGSKLNHILKNGVAKWNDETEYLSGATIQHNGSIWLCKETNVNSEPTDSNNNWDKIPSIENLALTVDTIDEFPTSATTGNTCIVKDLDRGGIFIYDSTKVSEDNQGTNFNGWVRQYSGAVNIKWFGAKGDGVADDTVAIQNAINYSDNIVGDNDEYYIGDNFLDITSPVSIRDIKLKLNTKKVGLYIKSSNVHIDNIEINGTDFLTYDKGGKLIHIIGVDNGVGVAPTYITDVTIKNSKLFNSSSDAIKAEYVDGLVVNNCEIFNVKYAGFGGSSCKNSIVKNCKIYNISDGNEGYGGYWSHGNSSDSVRYPVSEKCTFENNRVDGVSWEGLDTHGGNQIRFLNNYITNCGAGIAIIAADDESQNTRDSTIKNQILGNTIEDCTQGINVTGYPSDIDSSYHTQLMICNNNLKNCGDELSGGDGAIRLRKTIGAIVSNNQLSSSIKIGIVSLNDNLNCLIEGNTFLHVISNTGSTSAINIFGDNFSGIIGGNTLSKYQTGLPNDSVAGLTIGTTLTNISANTYYNNFKVATYPYNMSDAMASSISYPAQYSGSDSITLVIGVNTISKVITLPQTMSGIQIYDVFVSMATAIPRNVRLKARKLTTSTIEVTVETTDSANFTGAATIGFSYMVCGF